MNECVVSILTAQVQHDSMLDGWVFVLLSAVWARSMSAVNAGRDVNPLSCCAKSSGIRDLRCVIAMATANSAIARLNQPQRFISFLGSRTWSKLPHPCVFPTVLIFICIIVMNKIQTRIKFFCVMFEKRETWTFSRRVKPLFHRWESSSIHRSVDIHHCVRNSISMCEHLVLWS